MLEGDILFKKGIYYYYSYTTFSVTLTSSECLHDLSEATIGFPFSSICFTITSSYCLLNNMLLIQSVSKIQRWEKLCYCQSSRSKRGGSTEGWKGYISQGGIHILVAVLFEKLKLCMKLIISVKTTVIKLRMLSYQRKHLPTSCSEVMRTKFKQQFTELHTHASLLVCLAPCRHRT